MGLEEKNGLKEAGEKRNSIPMGMIYQKVRIGHYRPKVMQTKKVRD